jgi:glycosyltransferase involved in cell wall biosynthesis
MLRPAKRLYKNMPRIFYECLDQDKPAGGVRRLYRHVEILRDNGFDAYILHHSRPFRITWFKSMVPVVYSSELADLSDKDILVIPEGHIEVMRQTVQLPCRRVVIALNWARIFESLNDGETWLSLGIQHAIAGSRYEHHFIKETMGMNSSVIASGIDTEFFKPSSEARSCSITYMPRKNPEYAKLIIKAFRSMYPQFGWVQFVPIDGISHQEVATVFADSAIFLAHTFPEGLSRKMLEAMACGCVVVGFAGRGSLECMSHLENSILVDDADILGAATELGSAVGRFLDGTDRDMRLAAIKTAHRYSHAEEDKTVREFWRKFMSTM